MAAELDPEQELLERTLRRYMRPRDIGAFKTIARDFHAYVLVRRSKAYLAGNPAKDFFELANYVPKSLECKFKTADRHFEHAGFGAKLVGGLVVDPTVNGFAGAFSAGRRDIARGIWSQFAEHLVAFDAYDANNRLRPILAGGRNYFVQRNPASRHFGCLMHTPSGYTAHARYVHADYDLFDVVPADHPSENLAEPESRSGVLHWRGPQFADLQYEVRRRMGKPLVQHGGLAQLFDPGAHDSLARLFDQQVDAFFPDGRTVRSFFGGELLTLYTETFRGRAPFGPDAKVDTRHGGWLRTRPVRAAERAP